MMSQSFQECPHYLGWEARKLTAVHPVVQLIFISKILSINTNSRYHASKKIVHTSPGHVPWPSAMVTMIQCRARQKDKNKQTNKCNNKKTAKSKKARTIN